ncbi:flagellar hook protein FlgE [Rouxiella sp. WC2420]|uniref:Flagellar hook protein FlgE n=1 Tax=Rouxiella sp. WC2420 TaxID=3234145 RepID=A0AB39VQU4_9GAMM
MSFSIATSGLDAVTQQMNSVSNNIANAGTVGFKSGHTQFSALYANGQPMGVGVSKIAQSITRKGNFLASDSELHLAINGAGFFIVRDSSGAPAVTRAGTFGFDNQGRLSSNGMLLQGHGVDAKGALQTGALTDLKISNGAIPAKASDTLGFTANLDSNAKVPTTKTFDPADASSFNSQHTSEVYDSLGGKHQLTQYFVKTGVNKWDVHYVADGKVSSTPPQSLTFNSSGKLLTPTGPLMLNSIFTPTTGAAAISLAVDYAGTSQYQSPFDVTQDKSNGYPTGQKTGQRIDEDGTVYATFSNGERLLQGQLVLANFRNPNGLSPQDNTTWQQTSASGEMLTGNPGTGLYGSIKASMLEESNVDLTAELVGLMTAQRSYQANTKVISTDNSMMTALFQAL